LRGPRHARDHRRVPPGGLRRPERLRHVRQHRGHSLRPEPPGRTGHDTSAHGRGAPVTTTLRRAFLVLTVIALLGSYYVAPYIPADVPLVAEWAGHGRRIVEGVLGVFSALHDLVVVDGGPIL